jgi:moderate conductance mechanosensitive channel
VLEDNTFVRENLVPVIVILAVAYLIRKFAMVGVSRLVRRTIKGHKFKTKKAEEQREETLIRILGAGIRIGIWVVTGLMLLGQVGLDIGPLLAGAGVAGVALGFGAQSMVKDLLAGIFIIMENQYRVDDVVQVNQSVSGVVEEITLRKTVLRDLDGMVHHIPNGNIDVATNMTMDYASVNLDIGVGYSTDIEKLEKLINNVGHQLASDSAWKDKIMEAPQFLRVNDFADSAIIVKILGKTIPIKQWEVTGELRKRLKIAFDKEGIEIPFPQRVIHNPDNTSK